MLRIDNGRLTLMSLQLSRAIVDHTYYPLYAIRHTLILFEILHPFGPVFGLGTAGKGPGAGRVELAVPLQGPQLFEPYSADGEVNRDCVV